MAEIKNSLSVSVSIAQVMIDGIDLAASKALNVEFEKHGLPKGSPVQVVVEPRKYDYLATATWAKAPEAEGA